jgi:hypothetical protein
MPSIDQITGGLNAGDPEVAQRLADLFESLAAVLRSGARHVSRRADDRNE